MFRLFPPLIVSFLLSVVSTVRGDLLATADLRGNSRPAHPGPDAPSRLAQLAELLEQTRRADATLLLDAGNAFHGRADIENSREMMATFFDTVGFHALNITPADVSDNPEELVERLREHELPAISANLVHRDTREPLLPGYVRLEHGGRSIQVIGLSADMSDETLRTLAPDVALLDPAEALHRALSDADAVDRVLIMFHGTPLAAMQAITPVRDRIHAVVLNGHGNAKTLAGIPLLFAGENGQQVARLRLDEDPPTPQILKITQDTPTHAGVQHQIDTVIASHIEIQNERMDDRGVSRHGAQSFDPGDAQVQEDAVEEPDRPETLPRETTAAPTPLEDHPIPPTGSLVDFTPSALDEDPLENPPEGGQALDASATNRQFRFRASHVYFFDQVEGDEWEEGHILLGIRLEVSRIPDAAQGEIDLRDLDERLFGVLNGRTLKRWNRDLRRNPIAFGSQRLRLRMDEDEDTKEGLVFYEVPADQLAAFELHGLDPEYGNVVLPILPVGEEIRKKTPIHALENPLVRMEIHGMEFRESFLGESPSRGTWLVFDLRGRGNRQTVAQNDSDDGTDPVTLATQWRDWQPRAQIVIDGKHAFPLQREGTALSRDPFFFLPERSVGGEIAFDLPPDLLEDAASVELVLGFHPAAIPGEQVHPMDPIRFVLKGTSNTPSPAEDPLFEIDDLDLTARVLNAKQPEDLDGSGAGRRRSWHVLDVEITAKADEGVDFSPEEYLELVHPNRESISMSAIHWSGHPDTARSSDRLWIPSGDRRRARVIWRPRLDPTETAVQFRFNGLLYYRTHPLPYTDGVALPEDAPDPETKKNISEHGRMVFPEAPEPQGIAGVDLEPEQVNQAIDRGRDYLWAFMKEIIDDEGYIPQSGRGARYNFPAVYALINTDAHLKYPEFDDALRHFLRRYDPREHNVYVNGLMAMILRAYNDPAFLDQFEEITRYFIEAQGLNGTWDYNAPVPDHFFSTYEPPAEIDSGGLRITGGSAPPEEPHELPDHPLPRTQSFALGNEGDNSTTQFAILGLWSAQRAGIEVDPDVWRRALRSASRFQNVRGDRFGGFGYRGRGAPRGSMTAAVVSTLALSMRQLDDEIDPLHHQRIRNGLHWMTEHFSVEENPGQRSGRYNYYYLYSLERLGQILGTEFIGEHEWYPLGARFLVDLQNNDGSWPERSAESDPRMTTALPLLFLLRATPGADEELQPEPEGPGQLVTVYDPPEDAPSLYFIFDASGSMRAEIDGVSMFDLSRDALSALTDELPDDSIVGLRAFGHRYHALHDLADEDTELLVPGGPLDREAFADAMRRLRPRGKTPLALTLEEAAGDLRSRRWRGDRMTKVIMFTDGAEDTREDPVEAAQNFAERTDVEFFMLGFGIENPVWLQQLEEIASTAGGLYHNVEDLTKLLEELQALIHPPAPEFELFDAEGQRIATGTYGDDTLELEPGEYRLRSELGDEIHESQFWIRPNATTRARFDWSAAARHE
ncbi:MAG: VWA domain-containing protein [Verrucomicrobia bacterium]|nr:VWA domain-containing protein [Verrucomicrobiota bacterium]